VLLVTACSGDPIDRDIDGLVTIDNGLYGQLTVAQNNTNTSTAMVLAGDHVTVFTTDQPPTVLMSTTSDDRGFFQLETGPGTFSECTGSATPANGTTNPGPCTQTTVDSGNVRRDWVENLLGGNWCNGACTADDDNVN
jgi:hypothetical protein